MAVTETTSFDVSVRQHSDACTPSASQPRRNRQSRRSSNTCPWVPRHGPCGTAPTTFRRARPDTPGREQQVGGVAPFGLPPWFHLDGTSERGLLVARARSASAGNRVRSTGCFVSHAHPRLQRVHVFRPEPVRRRDEVVQVDAGSRDRRWLRSLAACWSTCVDLQRAAGVGWRPTIRWWVPHRLFARLGSRTSRRWRT